MIIARDMYFNIYAGIYFKMSYRQYLQNLNIIHSMGNRIKYALYGLMLLTILLLTGCTGKIFSDDSIFAPKPLPMNGPDKKKGSADYLEGWDDGCKTGLSTMVSGYYKSFYGYKIDPYRVSNATYYKAWKDAYTYCRQYSFRYSWDALDRQNNKLGNPLCIICPNELDRQQ